jgi:hypothetical protein
MSLFLAICDEAPLRQEPLLLPVVRWGDLSVVQQALALKVKPMLGLQRA